MIWKKDWKNDLKKYLNSKGNFEFDYHNQLLKEYLEEWKDFLYRFNIYEHAHIIATIEEKRPEGDKFLYQMQCISISNPRGQYFRAYLIYTIDEVTGKYCLKIKATSGISPEGIIQHTSMENENNYYWKEITHFEPKIIEKNHVLIILNSLLKEFNENTNAFSSL